MQEAFVRMDDDALAEIGLGEFARRCRAAGVREVTQLSCTGSGGVLVVETEREIEDADPGAVPGVERWERLDRRGSEAYLFVIEAPDLPADLDGSDPTCGERVAVAEGGFDVSLVGERSSVRERLRTYEDAGMGLTLRRLTEFDGRAAPLDALTDRQRQVLAAAFEAGYFDVPRTATAADVAAEFDLDDSTVVEHLRRAERNLLDRLLARQ